jgi:hypothetical protein
MVLPPPGTLIWRLPGFIRPRCTAGATHRLAESYYGVVLHVRKIACQRTVVISKDESQCVAALTGEFHPWSTMYSLLGRSIGAQQRSNLRQSEIVLRAPKR